VQPGTDLRIGAPLTRTSSLPQPSRAVRREIRFMSSGEPNQQTFLYTPITTTRHLPTLLTVYPGPVDTWEGVSVPLAAAGYAVIAIGPAYTLNLAPDVAELRRLMQFAHAGRLPGADGSQIVALGGSYSSLHVLRLLDQDARDVNLQGAVLLGPPTDLFDLRRRFEEGSFFPPYGLDQALIALGMPNTAPQRYWRYSGRYHIQADWPPLLLMHSRDDEIVPFQQTELFAAELEQAGTEYEAYFFDGMPHYLLADEYSAKLDRLYTITIDFLESRTE
jgi:dipeptidyl aminopeptidase/acylaminoacyl peptidase